MGPLRSSIKLHLWLIDIALLLYIATDLTLDMAIVDLTCAQARALAFFFPVAILVLGTSFSAHVFVTGGVYAEQPTEPPRLEEGVRREKDDPALAIQPNDPPPDDEEGVRRQKDDPALALCEFLMRWIMCTWACEAIRALIGKVVCTQCKAAAKGDGLQ